MSTFMRYTRTMMLVFEVSQPWLPHLCKVGRSLPDPRVASIVDIGSPIRQVAR